MNFQNHPFLTASSQLKESIKDYSSPGYYYNLNLIKSQYDVLKSILPSIIEIYYAVKSNPHTRIVKFISGFVSGCDTASLGELKLVMENGFIPDKVMITGPSKSVEELKYSVNNNISAVNIESIDEMLLLDKICKESSKEISVIIRINPKYETGESNKIIGGTGPSKFGIDEEQLDEVFSHLENCANLTFKGIHIFNSSQILKWESIFQNTVNVIETAKMIESKYGRNISVIDLGGGFGIPYSTEEKELDIKLLSTALNDSFNSDYKSFLNNKKLIFELGRYLTGYSGAYLTKVNYIKKSRGVTYLLVDGGVHHLLRPALIGQPHPVINLTALFENRNDEALYTIAGPLCTSLDEFGSDIKLAETKENDILAVLNAGAYGYTESMPLFLSHSPAQQIFL